MRPTMIAAAFVLSVVMAGLVPRPAFAQGLPVAVQVDILLTKLKRNLGNSSVAAQVEALKSIDKIRKLVPKPPASLSYFEAEAARTTGDILRAQKAAADYVNRAGRKGKHYVKVLELLVDIEPKVAAARKAEEERQRQEAEAAERKMLAEIKAKREAAEARRQAEEAQRQEEAARQDYKGRLDNALYVYKAGGTLQVKVLLKTTDGGLFIGGHEVPRGSGGAYRPYAARVDASGKLVWEGDITAAPGFQGSFSGHSISGAAETYEGGFALALDGPGFREAMLGSDGVARWARDTVPPDDAAQSIARDVVILPKGDLIVVGQRKTSSQPVGHALAWARLGPGGKTVDSGSYGNRDDGKKSVGSRVFRAGARSIYIAGPHDAKKPDDKLAWDELTAFRSPTVFKSDLSYTADERHTLWPKAGKRAPDYCCGGEVADLFRTADGCLVMSGRMTTRSGYSGKPTGYVAKMNVGLERVMLFNNSTLSRLIDTAPVHNGGVAVLLEADTPREPNLVLLNAGLRRAWDGNVAIAFPDGTTFKGQALAQLTSDTYAVAGAIRRPPEIETLAVIRASVPVEKFDQASLFAGECKVPEAIALIPPGATAAAPATDEQTTGSDDASKALDKLGKDLNKALNEVFGLTGGGASSSGDAPDNIGSGEGN